MVEKEMQQVIIHRFDPSLALEKWHEHFYANRVKWFFMIVYWAVFFTAEGLLFYEKAIGNVTEDLFWSYTFVIIGLLLFLKAATLMLFRRRKTAD